MHFAQTSRRQGFTVCTAAVKLEKGDMGLRYRLQVIESVTRPSRRPEGGSRTSARVRSGPCHKYDHAPRASRRWPRKARGGSIQAVFDPVEPKPSAGPGGMHRRSNAAVFMTRATTPQFRRRSVIMKDDDTVLGVIDRRRLSDETSPRSEQLRVRTRISSHLGRRTHAAFGHCQARGGSIRAVFDPCDERPNAASLGMHRRSNVGSYSCAGP